MLDKLLNKEDVLKYVQFKGPLIPVHLVSLLKSNTIMIGAALSELASDGKVKISHMKVGGSPLYFVDSQRAKLQDFYKYLNEKDRRTFDELKRQKVLRDSVVTPLLRISLRNIKDFAVPIEIEHNSVKELFWRWYLLDKQEAVGIIKSLLFINSVKKEEIRKETAVETTGKSAEIKQTSAIQQATQNPAVKAENPESNIAKKKEKTEKVTDRQERQKVEEFIKPTSEQTSLLSAQTLLDTCEDQLIQKCKIFFNQKSIIVKELNIIKKEKEATAIIRVPSSIGDVDYYCSIRNKKRMTDVDLAAVYLEAQNKKLLAVVLTTGEFTKKAYEKVHNQFYNMKLLTI